MIVREWEVGANGNIGTGWHYVADASLDWTQTAPERISLEPVSSTLCSPFDTWIHHSTDFRTLVDADGDLHTVYEAHQHPYAADSCAIFVAYKASSDPDLWHGDSLGTVIDSGTSPRLAFEPGTPDNAHLIYDKDGSTYYSSLPLDGSGGWSTPGLLSDRFVPRNALSGVVVAPDGEVHAFGVEYTNSGPGSPPNAPDTLSIRHAYGFPPPGGGDWTAVSDTTLDRYLIPAGGPGGTESEASVSTQDLSIVPVGAGATIHLTWHHLNGSGVTEVRYLNYDTVNDVYSDDLVTNPGSEPVPWDVGEVVTPGNPEGAFFPAVALSGSGDLSLFYHEPVGLTDTTRVYHTIRNATSGAWSIPQEFTPERRTNVYRPHIVADEDTLFVTFQSLDNADPDDDGRYQAWFRRGYPMPADPVPAGQTVTWDGVIVLDRDVTIPSTSTLTIDSGSVVLMASNVDSSSTGGFDSSRIELIVQGTLEIGEGVVFQASAGNAGGWYGIRRIQGATLTLPSAGTFEIRDAEAGLIDEATSTSEWPDLTALDQAAVFSNTNVDVGFDGDQVVADADTVVVPAGLRLGFKAGANASLVVEGVLLAEGNSGSEIEFGSFGGTGAAGEWGGLRFDLQGVEGAYGFAAAKPYSKLKDVKIKNAAVGVTVVDMIPPQMDNVTFENLTVTGGLTRHVYLDKADVAIPFGWQIGDSTNWSPMSWVLEAPMNVVASNVSESDITYGVGDSDKVDLFVSGVLKSKNSSGVAPAYVVFRPETENDATADGWGGIKALPDSHTNLRFAKMSHAPIPLNFYGVDSSFVRDSEIHYYGNIGINIFDGGGRPRGVTIDNCVVARGGNAGAGKGMWGVMAQGVHSLRIKDSEITENPLSGTPAAGGGGIMIAGGFHHCASSPATPDSIVVSGNDLTGFGNSVAGRTGLHLLWTCGASDRPFRVETNQIYDWKTGVNLQEARDLDLKCNLVQECETGVLWTRVASTDPEVALRTNYVLDNTERGFETNSDIDKLALGAHPLVSDRGLNIVELPSSDKRYVKQDATSGTLRAEHNQWVNVDAIENTAGGIRGRCEGNTNLIAVEEFEGGSISQCWPDPVGGGSVALASGGQGPDGQESRDPAAADLAGGALSAESGAVEVWPEVTGISSVRPNPGSGATRVRLSVRLEDAGIGKVSVHDVGGRTIRVLEDGMISAGWTVIPWDGRDALGKRVASGVYFLHLRLGTTSETRKIVRVR